MFTPLLKQIRAAGNDVPSLEVESHELVQYVTSIGVPVLSM